MSNGPSRASGSSIKGRTTLKPRLGDVFWDNMWNSFKRCSGKLIPVVFFLCVQFSFLSVVKTTDSLEANSCPETGKDCVMNFNLFERVKSLTASKLLWGTTVKSIRQGNWDPSILTPKSQRLPFLMRRDLQSSIGPSQLVPPKVPSCRRTNGMRWHPCCHDKRNEHHRTPTAPGTRPCHDESRYIPRNPRDHRNRVALWQRWRWKAILSKATPSMASRERMVKLGGGKHSAIDGHDRMYQSL